MDNQIILKEVSIDEAFKVHVQIPEFKNDLKYTKEYSQEHCKGKDTLIIVAYLHNSPIGYLVAYDKFDDGSFYCWMTGVLPDYRKRGVFKAMMSYLEEIAKQKGYFTIKIKTRNNRREMLAYLIKHGFYFTEVIPFPNIEDNRIVLEKRI